MNGLSQFAAFFTSGGPFMYVILVVAVLCLALAAERLWVIGRAASVNSAKLTRDVLRLAAAGNDAQAVELCRQVKGPVANVALAVLTRGHATRRRCRARPTAPPSSPCRPCRGACRS
jgi:biopolymer transport protein ExbB/TolQ